MNREDIETESGSAFWYLLGGAAVGTVLGLLLAPKSGRETMDDLAEWRSRARDRAQGLISRVSEKIPARVKGAAIFGAVREGGKEALSEAKDKAREFTGS